MFVRLSAAAGALVLLVACDMKIGKQDERAETTANAEAGSEQPAGGKAEDGRLSIQGPGFDMKINIPKDMARRASGDGDNELLYPGAAISGMHIEASKPSSGVEMRFATPDAPQKVAAWYRDPGRASGFQVQSAKQEGDAIVISGAQKGDGDPFSLRLSPASGGGTEGRLILTDRK
jgi:hypothetical protein